MQQTQHPDLKSPQPHLPPAHIRAAIRAASSVDGPVKAILEAYRRTGYAKLQVICAEPGAEKTLRSFVGYVAHDRSNPTGSDRYIMSDSRMAPLLKEQRHAFGLDTIVRIVELGRHLELYRSPQLDALASTR